MRRAIAILLFLMLVDDGSTTYAQHIPAPFFWVHPLLVEAPLKVRLFDVAIAAIFVAGMSKKDAKGPRVAPVKRALLLSLYTTLAWFAYGLVRGGDFRSGSWQVYLMLSAVLVAFAIASAFRTPEHFVTLAKALFFASMYRAVMCIVFYATHIHTMLITPPPEFLTTHDDTVKWVATLVMLAVYAIETRSRRARTWAIASAPILLLAIQLNNRRLAWVSLAMAVAVVALLLRPSKTKRRIRNALLAVTPVAAIYVAVGWGRTERFFKPIHSLETVTTHEDASTKARNVENLGLIHTASSSSWLVGTGWGHGYIEVSNKYRIDSAFALWRYVPHNSILGLLAYTGMLGFAGYWLIFPTAAFVNVRTARLGKEPLERVVGIVSLSNMVIAANQMYGDMGIFSPAAMYLLAGSYAAALRIPIAAHTWPAAGAKRAAKRASPVPDAPPAPLAEPPAPPPTFPGTAA